LAIAQHQTEVPRYGAVFFLMGDAHPTGLLNEIATKAQQSPSNPTYYLRIDGNHKK